MASADEELVPVIDKEKLVNFVCNCEFLYNKDDKMYKNKPNMLAARREIAKNLGISGI